jgi:hypothetical protein
MKVEKINGDTGDGRQKEEAGCTGPSPMSMTALARPPPRSP